ncbi:hypothetical protein SETIT_2G003300v2 [Setaria italica]|uniref:EF-hand domain-containing protein n=1 Tax=Setaria italica TaxID=4555 RepID=K4A106_SETIT|nr:neo-calmodulin [Setaria italica]RCV09147.1 hypothetical protein SETIT_2G003300v2 [Setaria italica]
MAERFTQIKAAFDLFDRNMDGFITVEDLGAVLESLGQNNTAFELQSMIAMVDSDGDGAINFEEFSMLMELKPNGVDSDEEMTRAFRMFDMDKDGFISEAELCHIMYNLGSNLSGDEVKEMMRVADTDGDGRLSYEEFKQIMHRI